MATVMTIGFTIVTRVNHIPAKKTIQAVKNARGIETKVVKSPRPTPRILPL